MATHAPAQQQVVQANSGYTITYVCECGVKSAGAANATQATAVANAKAVLNSHLALNGAPTI